jgi:HEAT repeat protein
MRRRLSRPAAVAILGSALVLSSCSAAATRPETRPERTSLDAVLFRFPAATAAERDALAEELLKSGPEAVAALCARLAPAGESDDAAARFALDALVLRAARPGADGERKSLVQALARALKAAASPEVKVFLIGEIRIAGGREAVGRLSDLLRDARTAEAAAGALASIGGEDAERALIAALVGTSRETKAALIQALGRMRSRRAIPKLLPFATGEVPPLRSAGLQALAEIGDRAASPAFRTISLLAPAGERLRMTSLLLLFGQRLRENGDNEAALEIGRGVLRGFVQPAESQFRCRALTLIFGILGPAALDDLVETAVSDDREVRVHALGLAASLPGPGPTARLLAAFAGAAPGIKADLLAALGRRGDAAALPVARDGLKDADLAVRLAAMAALSRLAGADALADLLPFLSAGGPEEIAVVKDALLAAPAALALSESGRLLDAVPAAAKVALLEVLSARRAEACADRILGLIRAETPEVAKAALLALEGVAGAADLPRLLSLLVESADPAETAPLQNALASAALRVPDPDRRADPILAAFAYASPAKSADLLRVLPKIGGTKALGVVIAETRSADPLVQAVAVYALSQWPEAAALDPLLETLRTNPDLKARNLAFQGIARLSRQASLEPDERRRILTEAWALSGQPGEKKILLPGLGDVRTPEALALAAAALDDPDLRDLAAEAVLGIALPRPGVEGLAGVETALALRKAAHFLEVDYEIGRAEAHAAAILVKEGFVPLFDGRTLAGWKGLVADPPARARMTASELRAAQAAADENMRRHWRAAGGVLLFDGTGHSLCTARDFGDFELLVDWRIEPQGDSGIYLRGSPQVQIWDPARWPEGSGGLYNNKAHPSKPMKPADNPVGTWNTFRILMKGERVTVWLNGALVVDDVVMENYWERDKPIYPSGQIELQAHSTPLAFKNIFIRIL